MIASLFTVYFLAMMAIYAKKRKLAIALLIVGLLFMSFLLWFHATDKLGIRL